jgi:tetrahydromethanopterin S-methyltransferase subunit B
MNRSLSENTAAMSDNEKGYTALAIEGEKSRQEQQAMLNLQVGMGSAFEGTGENLDELTKKYIASQDAIKAQSEAGGEIITKQTNIIETQYRKQEDSMNALMQSLEPTKSALQEFLTGKLEGYYPGGDRYSELGGVIDTLFDTTILKTQAATEEAKKLWAEYEKTGDEAALIAGAQDVMAKDFIDTADVDTQTDAVERFADAIVRLTGLPHNIVFKITAQIMGDLGGGPSGRVQGGLADEERRTGKDINGNGIIGVAGGLRNYTVPPGFTGDSYPVMAQTGEHVTVEPVGERGRYGSGGSLTNYGHITVVSNPSSTIDLLQSLQGAMA